MDYAINLHQANLQPQITAWLNKATGVKDSTKWLLIDASLLDQNAFVRLTKPYEHTYLNNVFLNTRFEVYGLHAPHLFRINLLEDKIKVDFIKDLLNLCNGIPAIALLDAWEDAESLAQCLAWHAQCYTPDGLELYLRFADTRITPGLLQVLDDEQKLKLGENILQWQIVNRMGTLEALLPPIKPRPDDKTPFIEFRSSKSFNLTDAQFATLMIKSEPDQLFQMLLENHADLVPGKDRGVFHQRIDTQVGNAHKHGLTSTQDLFSYTFTALTTHDKFDTQPVLEETWKNIKEKGASFTKLTDEWPDSIWNQLNVVATSK